MNIPPIIPQSHPSHINPAGLVDGHGDSRSEDGMKRNKENKDEFSFETKEEKIQKDKFEDIDNKVLLTIIKGFFISLYNSILKFFGIKADNNL